MTRAHQQQNRKTPQGSQERVCREVRQQLFSYVSNELGHRATMRIRAHLRHCPSCTAEAESIRVLVAGLRANDPGDEAKLRIEGHRRGWLLWWMSHPFVATCLRYHRTTSICVAVVILALVFWGLLHMVHFILPPETTPPVRLIVGGEEVEVQNLDEEPSPHVDGKLPSLPLDL